MGQAAPVEPAPPRGRAGSAARGGRCAMRVLVADDRGVLAPTCVVFLAWWGHEVEVARDGLEALRMARAWRPDLVIAPVLLERMGGLSLLAALRAGGLRDTAVVLVGGSGDPVTPARALGLGAIAVVEEPLSVADLGRVVERCTRGRPAVAAR